MAKTARRRALGKSSSFRGTRSSLSSPRTEAKAVGGSTTEALGEMEEIAPPVNFTVTFCSSTV
jgi:hypothetical protein